jgi:tetratricopeptide (TPR) repeat protein
MTRHIRQLYFGLIATLAIVGSVVPAAAQERFEVTSIKAVRPTLVDTIGALSQRDLARAKEAFERYDSAWNGVEAYINVRSREMYQTLEHGFQARINKAFEASNPDLAAVLAEAQAMLVKFDEAVSLVEKAAPLNPLFDDVARLRIVRAHLREVNPALKAGNLAKARKSFMAFDDNWDSIEHLIKDRSADAYVAIEKGMIEIDQALMPEKPDVAQVTALVNAVTDRYNAILADIAKDARAAR